MFIPESRVSKGNIKFIVLFQNNPLFYAAWKPVELTLILHNSTVSEKLHKLDEFYKVQQKMTDNQTFAKQTFSYWVVWRHFLLFS